MPDIARRQAEIVAYYRALDAGASARRYFRHTDEEGGLWYFETVADRGELVAVKQIEVTPEGAFHRYHWEHLGDEHGFLTVLALNPDEDPLTAVEPEEFQRVWTQRSP